MLLLSLFNLFLELLGNMVWGSETSVNGARHCATIFCCSLLIPLCGGYYFTAFADEEAEVGQS